MTPAPPVIVHSWQKARARHVGLVQICIAIIMGIERTGSSVPIVIMILVNTQHLLGVIGLILQEIYMHLLNSPELFGIS